MNAKHLIWIIPIILIVGIIGGYRYGIYLSIDVLGGMVDKMDKCCLPTLNYVMEHNDDCNVLITGKMKDCYYNETEATADNSD